MSCVDQIISLASSACKVCDRLLKQELKSKKGLIITGLFDC